MYVVRAIVARHRPDVTPPDRATRFYRVSPNQSISDGTESTKPIRPMAWNNVHDDAPTNDDGVPIHPEKGYPICGYEKTDAVDKHGGKREDIPYCLQAAGWGTDRSTGHCRAHHGASTGAPEGWRNGSARHLLYSNQMSDEDREVFDAVVAGDDELLSVEDMADMLKNSVAWEFTRLQRAIDKIPDAELVEKYECQKCGTTHTTPLPDECTGYDMSDGHPEVCGARPTEFKRGERFVTFGDKAVERKESHLANLIKTYKQVTEGTDLNVTGDHDVTHKGDPDAPVEVSITHAGIDLPDDERVDDTDDGDGGDE